MFIGPTLQGSVRHSLIEVGSKATSSNCNNIAHQVLDYRVEDADLVSRVWFRLKGHDLQNMLEVKLYHGHTL